MAAQLERRFDFLTASRRRRDVGEPRHRSLAAALDWSYRLLTPDLQRFFRGLSVFRGGWTAESAATVCEEPRAGEFLERLREASFVLPAESGDGPQRFTMLETFREYADELTPPTERESLAERHEAYFARIAGAVDDHNFLPVRDIDNCLKAIAHSRARGDQGIENELLLVGGFLSMWVHTGQQRRAQAALEHALGRDDARRARNPGPATKGRSNVLSLGGWVMLGADPDRAAECAEEFLSILGESGDLAERAHATCQLSRIRAAQGDTAEGWRLIQESIALFRRSDNVWHLPGALMSALAFAENPRDKREALQEVVEISLGVGNKDYAGTALFLLSEMAFAEGDFPTVVELATRSIALSRSLNNTLHVFMALPPLCVAKAKLGDVEGARAVLDEAEQIMRDWEAIEPYIFRHLGEAALESGHLARAFGFYAEGLRRAVADDHASRVPHLLSRLGLIAERSGDPRRAARLLAAAFARFEEIGRSVPAFDEDGSESARRGELRTRLGKAAFADAWKKGRAMPPERAVAYALERPNSAHRPTP